MLRSQCNFEELEAHRILDGVAQGIETPETVIVWALWVLGDAVGMQ